MKKIMISFGLIIFLSANVMAGILPGGIQGSVEIKYEDDQQDADQSLSKSKLTLKKPSEIAGLSIIPYVYFEDESYDGILSADRKETESAIGLDVVAFKSDLIKITFGTIYAYEDNATGDDDALLIFKTKADF